MNNSNLVKFLSVIYNPKKYTFTKKQLVKMLKGFFKNKNDRKLIYNNLLFSSDKYYIKNVNSLFSPDKFSDKICNEFINARNSNIIWAFTLHYNESQEQYKFEKKILKFFGKKKYKNKFLKFVYKEINKVSNEVLYEKYFYNPAYDVQNFEIYQELERFGWELDRAADSSLKKLLYILCIINAKEWYKTIKQIKNPLVAANLNLYYRYELKNTSPSMLFTFNAAKDDSVVSLAILNCFEVIMRKKQINKYMNCLFLCIAKLNYRRFYWYGVILSNAENFIYKDKLDKIIKLTKSKLVEELHNSKNKELAVNNLCLGLNLTPTHTSYRHLDIYKSVLKNDKSLALKLMTMIVKDYRDKITKEKCYITLQTVNKTADEKGIAYTNNLIYSLTQLVQNNKFDIIDFSEQLLSKFLLSKEDYLYNFSKMISEKYRVLHIFIVIFGVIQSLEKTKDKVDGKKINDLFEKFINYINIHIKFEDNELINCLDYISGLKISFEHKAIYKTIEILVNYPNPPFKSIALLIKKVPENHKIKETKYFIESYFDKYYKVWLGSEELLKNIQLEKWCEICLILKDKKRAQICADGLPKYKRQNIMQVIETL